MPLGRATFTSRGEAASSAPSHSRSCSTRAVACGADLKGSKALMTTKMAPPWHAMPIGALSLRPACSGGRLNSLSASLSAFSVLLGLGATYVYSGGGANASMISSVLAEPGRGSTLRR